MIGSPKIHPQPFRSVSGMARNREPLQDAPDCHRRCKNRHRSVSVKKSSEGCQEYWRGYKLHLDVADGQIPITALLTGAGVHDSQLAISLMTLSSERVTCVYELMDKAYDAQAIRTHSQALKHRALTELAQGHRRIKEKVPIRKNSRFKKIVFRNEPIYRELTWAEQDRCENAPWWSVSTAA